MFARKIVVPLAAAVLPLAASAAPYHKLTTIELAVEMPAFEVRLDDDKRADLSAKPCDQCAPVTLHIDASTVLSRGGRPFALDTLNEAPAQGATLFYLPDTGRVTRIQIWH
jgi:hypothetical protein